MKPKPVDEYIKVAPEKAQEKLKEMRALLSNVAPKANKGLKWGKPVFESKTILFAYSAHKSHLSFIPTGSALRPFEEELSGYTVKKKILFNFAMTNLCQRSLFGGLQNIERRMWKKEMQSGNIKTIFKTSSIFSQGLSRRGPQWRLLVLTNLAISVCAVRTQPMENFED